VQLQTLTQNVYVFVEGIAKCDISDSIVTILVKIGQLTIELSLWEGISRTWTMLVCLVPCVSVDSANHFNSHRVVSRCCTCQKFPGYGKPTECCHQAVVDEVEMTTFIIWIDSNTPVMINKKNPILAYYNQSIQCFDRVGRQEEHQTCKNWVWWRDCMVVCSERGAKDLCMV